MHLALGFSHPVVYEYESEIDITTPSPTEIIVKGINNFDNYFESETFVLHKSSKTNKIIKNKIKK